MRLRNKIRALGLIVALCLGLALVLRWRWEEKRDHSQDNVILHAAARYGVDPALVKAVVWRESRFDPGAQGTSGEIGLMQVGDLAAHEWADAEGIRFFSHNQLYDPAKNTLAGTWYLKKMLRRYADTDDPIPYALADYNAGRANVLRWNKDAARTNSIEFIEHIGFPSTRHYVESVMIRYEHYQPLFPPRTNTATPPAFPMATNASLETTHSAAGF